MSVQEDRRKQPSERDTATRMRNLTLAAILFFVVQGIGAAIAIVNRFPAEAIGVKADPNNVARDALIGNGTAMSAPLTVLLFLALLILLARRRDRWGTLALGAIAVLTALMTVFASLEPITWRMLRASPFGLFQAVVVAQGLAAILLAILMAVFSILVLRERGRKNPHEGESMPA